MESTWESRDLPVLEAAVRSFEEAGRHVTAWNLASETGLTADQVQKALRALVAADPPYFAEHDIRANHHVSVSAPTERARRTGGAWPSAESMADRVVEALEDAATRGEDPERRGWLKKTATYLGSAGRDLAVEIGASTISRQVGGL